MADIKDVIHTYQARCEQALLLAEPKSAESMAYAPLLEVLKKHQSNPDRISLMLDLTVATEHRALRLAPSEFHIKGSQHFHPCAVEAADTECNNCCWN